MDDLKSYTPVSLQVALEKIPRRALQSMAKRFNVKANQKSSDIIRNLSAKLRDVQEESSDEEGELGGSVRSPVRFTTRYEQEQPREPSTTPGKTLLEGGLVNPLFDEGTEDAEQGAGKGATGHTAVPEAGPAAAAEDERAAMPAEAEQMAPKDGGAVAAPAEQEPSAPMVEIPPSTAAAVVEHTDGEEVAQDSAVKVEAEGAVAEAPMAEAGEAGADKPSEAPKVAGPRRSLATRRASTVAGRRSSIHREWHGTQAQKLQELEKNWSTVSTNVAAGKARSWKLPSAKDVKQISNSLAASGFTVVNSPGKNKVQAAGGKRKAEGVPSQAALARKTVKSSPMPGAGARTGSKAPTPSRLRNALGPAGRENAAGNLPATVRRQAKPPCLPKAPVAGKSMAERAKLAEAAFTARRVAMLQKFQQQQQPK